LTKNFNQTAYYLPCAVSNKRNRKRIFTHSLIYLFTYFSFIYLI